MSDETEQHTTSESFDGEEELLGGPPPPRDPYTPEPGPGPGEQRAFNIMRLAWIAIAAIVLVIVIYALLG